MKLIQIHSDISVVAGDFGELITIGPNHRVVMSLDYGSDLWASGSCSVQIWDPPGYTPEIDVMQLGGTPWVVTYDGAVRFTGFLQDVNVERTEGGYLRTFTLRDCLSAWDVLLTQKTYPDPPTVSATYKVTDALADMCTAADSVSGITSYGTPPTNAMLVTDMYEDGIMEVNNSSYLAEIQRICQNLGYHAFCDCAFPDVRILGVSTPDGSYTPDADSVISASFSIDATTIPATVFASSDSDETDATGVAYGNHGTGANENAGNFGITGIDNLVLASTVGIAEDHLAGIAHQVYDMARGGSKVLSVTVAGPEPIGRRIIGLGLVWTGGPYFIFAHHTHVDAHSYKTTYQAWGS